MGRQEVLEALRDRCIAVIQSQRREETHSHITSRILDVIWDMPEVWTIPLYSISRFALIGADTIRRRHGRRIAAGDFPKATPPVPKDAAEEARVRFWTTGADTYKQQKGTPWQR